MVQVNLSVGCSLSVMAKIFCTCQLLTNVPNILSHGIMQFIFQPDSKFFDRLINDKNGL